MFLPMVTILFFLGEHICTCHGSAFGIVCCVTVVNILQDLDTYQSVSGFKGGLKSALNEFFVFDFECANCKEKIGVKKIL